MVLPEAADFCLFFLDQQKIDTRLPHELFVSTFFFFLAFWKLKNDLTVTEDNKEHERDRNISSGFDSHIDLGKSDTCSRP